jgi:hypothetical protein
VASSGPLPETTGDGTYARTISEGPFSARDILSPRISRTEPSREQNSFLENILGNTELGTHNRPDPKKTDPVEDPQWERYPLGGLVHVSQLERPAQGHRWMNPTRPVGQLADHDSMEMLPDLQPRLP